MKLLEILQLIEAQQTKHLLDRVKERIKETQKIDVCLNYPTKDGLTTSQQATNQYNFYKKKIGTYILTESIKDKLIHGCNEILRTEFPTRLSYAILLHSFEDDLRNKKFEFDSQMSKTFSEKIFDAWGYRSKNSPVPGIPVIANNPTFLLTNYFVEKGSESISKSSAIDEDINYFIGEDDESKPKKRPRILVPKKDNNKFDIENEPDLMNSDSFIVIVRENVATTAMFGKIQRWRNQKDRTSESITVDELKLFPKKNDDFEKLI